MTKDKLLLLMRAKGLPKRVIKELSKCKSIAEILVSLPGAVGKEMVKRLKGG